MEPSASVAHLYGEGTDKGSATENKPLSVRVKGLRKSYGKAESRTDALIDVDLEAHRGEILGILGPNGAGKTTLVEILEGLRGKDAGSAHVLGEAIDQAAGLKGVRHRMGVAMQHTVLPPLLTVEELLHLHCAIFPEPRDPVELIRAVGLEEKRQSLTRHLSGGQQQRVTVALALVGNPDLVFLDEPTSQLDPQARHAVWELLEDQRQRRDATLIVTTHQMEEAQRLCDRVLILDHGRVLDAGPPGELVNRHCPERVVEFMTVRDADLRFLGETAETAIAGENQLRVKVRTDALDETVVEVMSRRARGVLDVDDLRVDRQNLEDVFLKLTGRRIRD